LPSWQKNIIANIEIIFTLAKKDIENKELGPCPDLINAPTKSIAKCF